MSLVFVSPFIPAFGPQGQYLAGAKLHFYLSGTTTGATVYADANLTTPLGSVVTADAYGRFAQIFLSRDVAYRVVLKTPNGNTVPGCDLDPIDTTRTDTFVTLEQFGGSPGYVSPTNRGIDNTDALMRALDAINRYAPVNSRWPRVPRIELGLGAYWFGQEIDLKVAIHLLGQGSGIDDFNGGSRLIFPDGSRGITINDSDTGGGTSLATPTTSAMGTILEGIQVEAEGKSLGTPFDWSTGAGGTNTCGIWMRATASIRNCSVKGFRGNAIQIIAYTGRSGFEHGNASGWEVNRVVSRDCDGLGLYVTGGDANVGKCSLFKAQTIGLGAIADIDTLGNYYDSGMAQGTAYATQPLVIRAACWYGGIRYNLVDPTPSIGATTTPGTNSDIWYPLEAAASESDFYKAWDNTKTYQCMTPILCRGQSNASVFNGCYIEGGQPAHLANSTAVAIGGIGVWTRESRRMAGAADGTKAVYSNTGFAQRVYTAPGSADATNFGSYYEAGVGGSYEPATFWYGRCDQEGGNDWMYGYVANGEIQQRRNGGSVVERLSTAISNRTFGRSANVPYIKAFPGFAIADPDDSTNDRIWRAGVAAPTSGNHAAGERVWNAAPGAGKPDYWECIATGTPGTWIGVNVTPWQSGVATSALTGSTTETAMLTFTVPGGTLGPKGGIDIDVLYTVPNNANTKTLRARLGGLTGFAFWSQALTTSASARGLGGFKNRGAANSQVAFSGPSFGSNTSAVLTGSIDTSVDQTLVITGQLGVGTDSIVIESYSIKITPSA